MKTLFIISSLIFFTLSIPAQSSIGFESGINLGNVNANMPAGADTQMRTGFHAGFNIEAEFSDDGSFIFGFDYSQKGNTSENEIVRLTQKLNYIEFPVTLNYKFKGNKITPTLGAGFYFGMLTLAKRTEEYNSGEKYETDNFGDFKNGDFGFLINAGINYRVSKLIQVYTAASYYFGTKNVLADELDWLGEVRNTGPRLSAGLKLSI